MNKCRVPKIPPIFVNNLFIVNCKEKAKHFNHYFSQQCKRIINRSVLPALDYLTEKRIDHITIENDEIISFVLGSFRRRITMYVFIVVYRTNFFN